MTIREATHGDVGPLAKALTAAFDDDPVWRWTVPSGPGRRARLERFFTLELTHIGLPRGTVWATPGDEGAALILPPDKWKVPMTTQVRHAPQVARVFGPRLPRALGLLLKMEARHLREPHVYVAYVGVHPSAQGRGFGRRLLEPALAHADEQRLPAFLEASSADSARLYRRLGFEDLEEVRFAGSPPMALMRRDPV